MMNAAPATQTSPSAPIDQTQIISSAQLSAMEIPKLTTLLKHSSDPELFPYLHINRVYPYPMTRKLVKLPAYLHVPQRIKRLPGPDWVESQGFEDATRKRHKYD
jgi:hypothetical protein